MDRSSLYDALSSLPALHWSLFFPNINVQALASSWLVLPWCVFLHPFCSSLSSLQVELFSCTECSSCFSILSDSLCSNWHIRPFLFSMTVYMAGFIADMLVIAICWLLLPFPPPTLYLPLWVQRSNLKHSAFSSFLTNSSASFSAMAGSLKFIACTHSAPHSPEPWWIPWGLYYTPTDHPSSSRHLAVRWTVLTAITSCLHALQTWPPSCQLSIVPTHPSGGLQMTFHFF